MTRVFLRLVTGLFFYTILLLPGIKTIAAVPESRAIFDQHFNWLTSSDADKTLLRIKEAGFNVFIPCVWIGRGTSWPSELAPMSPEWKAQFKSGYDPLAYLIKTAHAMGIEVHPWFTVMYRTRDFLYKFYDLGTPENAFDVHVPEFRKFIVNLMLEVVRNYDVDGINLDYIRAVGICTSRHCIKDYRTKTNRDLRADSKLQKELPQAWESLKEWNRNAVSNIVSDFSLHARKIKPQILISVDSIVEIRDFKLQGADSIHWSNNGWIDIIYHMDYAKMIHADLVELGKSHLKHPESLVVLVGNVDWPGNVQGSSAAFSRNPQLVADLLSYTQNKWGGGNGVALWTYKFLTDEQIDQIKTGPFKESAKPAWIKH